MCAFLASNKQGEKFLPAVYKQQHPLWKSTHIFGHCCKEHRRLDIHLTHTKYNCAAELSAGTVKCGGILRLPYIRLRAVRCRILLCQQGQTAMPKQWDVLSASNVKNI